jgi:hypothetical protein
MVTPETGTAGILGLPAAAIKQNIATITKTGIKTSAQDLFSTKIVQML